MDMNNPERSELSDNVLLMLSFFEKMETATAEERKQYQSLMTNQEVVTGTVGLVGVMLRMMSQLTSQPHEEVCNMIRKVVLNDLQK